MSTPAPATVRFLIDDLLQSAVDIILSSAQAGFGSSGLLRQGGEWRSKIGWTVVDGVNSGIHVRIGGLDFPGDIAAGYYATATAYAEAVRVALEAANGVPVWAVDYNVAAADKFRISSDVAFILKGGSSGSHSAHPDLGFASVDTAAALSHTAGAASYQSRHWIAIDRGSALPVSAAVVKHHNLSATGVARFDVFNSPLDATGLAGVGLTVAATLAGTTTRAASFAPVTERYLRFVFEDVSNPAGYVSVAIARPSLYAQPSEAPSVEYAEDSEHLSENLIAIDGTGAQLRRARRRVFYLLWQVDPRKAGAAADLALFDTLDALGVGGKLFVILDSANPATTTWHVELRKGIPRPWVVGTYWGLRVELAEAL